MPARLPIVAGDSNAWGTILNAFLSVAHNADGSLKNLFFNVKDPAYGAVGNGIADDTAAIQAARSAANAIGGGMVFYPPGIYITGNQTLYANVIDIGAGIGVTTIKLKNGTNTDLFSGQTSSINLSAVRATGIDGTLYGFGFMNLTLDGNKANQTSGPSWCLRFYGYGFTFENLECVNGFSGDALIDWNGTGIHNHNGVEAKIRNFHCHNASGMGLQMGGPHDSQITNLIVSENGGINLHLAPNAVGIQIDNFHSWGNFGTGLPGVLIEGGDNEFSNAVFESPSDTATYCLVLAANNNQINGKCLSSGAFSGVHLGQNSGVTPIPGQILQSAGVTTFNPADNSTIDMIFEACTGTNGALNFDKVHYSRIKAVTIQASGSAFTGFLDPTNQFELIAPNGLTPDGSVGKGGQTRIAADSNNAFTVGGAGQYLDYFNVSTHTNPRFEMPNGVYLQFYSDQYSTVTSALRTGIGAPSNGVGNNGDIYIRGDTPGTAYQQLYIKIAGAWIPFAGAPIQSATAPALATGGTITTAGVNSARVAPTGAVTGVILQAGTIAGQEVTVVNESAFSITFAVVGTSNVADGVSAVIAANRAMYFKWNSVTAKWYHS
jgi:hypothetical protein